MSRSGSRTRAGGQGALSHRRARLRGARRRAARRGAARTLGRGRQSGWRSALGPACRNVAPSLPPASLVSQEERTASSMACAQLGPACAMRCGSGGEGPLRGDKAPSRAGGWAGVAPRELQLGTALPGTASAEHRPAGIPAAVSRCFPSSLSTTALFPRVHAPPACTASALSALSFSRAALLRPRRRLPRPASRLHRAAPRSSRRPAHLQLQPSRNGRRRHAARRHDAARRAAAQPHAPAQRRCLVSAKQAPAARCERAERRTGLAASDMLPLWAAQRRSAKGSTGEQSPPWSDMFSLWAAPRLSVKLRHALLRCSAAQCRAQ
jgi:hypothetical protein